MLACLCCNCSYCLSPLPRQSDRDNNLLRRVNLTSGFVATLAGGLGGVTSGSADGVGSVATFYRPSSVAVDAAGVIAIVVRREDELWGGVSGGGRARAVAGGGRVRRLCVMHSETAISA